MTGAERKDRWKQRHAFKWPGQPQSEIDELEAWERSAFDQPTKHTANVIRLQAEQ